MVKAGDPCSPASQCPDWPEPESSGRKRRSTLGEGAPPDTTAATTTPTTQPPTTAPTTATTAPTTATTQAPSTPVVAPNPCDQAGAADHGGGCHTHTVPQCSPDGPTTYTYHDGSGDDAQFPLAQCPGTPRQDSCEVETTTQVVRGTKGGVWTEAVAGSVWDAGWDAEPAPETTTRVSVKYVC